MSSSNTTVVSSSFREEVAGRFGVLPSVFCSARSAAGLTEELWAFAKSAYLDNPLPSLLKERLFVHLSRFCEVRYCIVRHVGFLIGLGRPAGDALAKPLTLQQLMRLLHRPIPDAAMLEQAFVQMESRSESHKLPQPESKDEAQLFDALAVMFLAPMHSMRARNAVRKRVGERQFEFFTAFLAFVRTAHYWTEMHPEHDYESDMVAYMQQHPELAMLLLDGTEAANASSSAQLLKALQDLDRTQDALQESEARSSLLMESIAQMTWETDGAGMVVADSHSWRAYTGQSLDEWLGHGWINAVHPDDRAHAQWQWRKAIAAKRAMDAEFRLWHAQSGGYRWINARAVPLFDEHGSIVKWIGMNIDVDTHKQVEAALQRSEAWQRYLLRLSDGLRPLGAPIDIEKEALRILGEHVDAAWAYYGEYERGGTQMTVLAEHRRAEGPSVVGTHPVASFGVLDELGEGRTIAIEDILTSPLFSDASRTQWGRFGMRSVAAVPIVKHGVLIAALIAADTVPRDWSEHIPAMEETAQRTWATIETARAEMRLRESEANLREKEVWLAAQKEAFQAAMNGAPLETCLGILVNAVVAWANDGRRCAFYIADAKGETLSHVAGMSDAYAAAVEGFEISPESVACGLAVATGKPVVTPDVLEDARWRPWQWLAREHGYRGCWSFPIETATGKLVGSFAFYFKEPHQAQAHDYELVTAITQAASIIVSRHQENEERLRIEEQQAFVLKLSDALRPLPDPHGIKAEAARQLGMHLRSDRAFYADVDADGIASIGAEYRTDQTPSMMGRYPLDNFGCVPGDALRAGRTLVVPDVKHWTRLTPREMHAYDALGIAAQIKVPLVKDERLVAFLGVHQRAVRDWSPGEVALVTDVAERTWAAVERACAEAALSAELDAMKTLHELSTITSGSSDVTKALEAALDVAMALHGADFGNVQLYDPATETLRIAVQRGFRQAFVDYFAQVDARHTSACGLALAGRERRIVTDVENDPGYATCVNVAREAGYRAVQSTPLFSAVGEPLGMLSTHFRAPRTFTESELRLTDLVAREIARVIERTRSQAALRESEERLRSAAEVGRLGLWDWNLVSGEVHWSDEHYRMAGYAVGEVVPSYEAWVARLHPNDRAPTEAALRHAMSAHEEYVREFRMVHPDGSTHWLYGRGRFFYGDDERPVRMIGAMVDTTERREWEERQKVLIGELQHRTRNLMSVVHSMAEKTARSSADLFDFRERFSDRLEALSRVQGLLSRLSEHDRVTFDDLIRSELAAMGGSFECTTLEGPQGVRLRSSTVQTLALALHELATNAVKYGALGQPQATLHVTWLLEPNGPGGRPWLHIDWQENGVDMPPDGEAPRGGGRGRELIEQALPYQLNAKTSYELGPDGVRCRISIPVSSSTIRPWA
jgi:PAS domain S-box-containing protein